MLQYLRPGPLHTRWARPESCVDELASAAAGTQPWHSAALLETEGSSLVDTLGRLATHAEEFFAMPPAAVSASFATAAVAAVELPPPPRLHTSGFRASGPAFWRGTPGTVAWPLPSAATAGGGGGGSGGAVRAAEAARRRRRCSRHVCCYDEERAQVWVLRQSDDHAGGGAAGGGGGGPATEAAAIQLPANHLLTAAEFYDKGGPAAGDDDAKSGMLALVVATDGAAAAADPATPPIADLLLVEYAALDFRPLAPAPAPPPWAAAGAAEWAAAVVEVGRVTAKRRSCGPRGVRLFAVSAERSPTLTPDDNAGRGPASACLPASMLIAVGRA